MTTTPARSALPAHYQSVPALATPMSDEEAIRLAMEEGAEEVAKEDLRTPDTDGDHSSPGAPAASARRAP